MAKHLLQGKEAEALAANYLLKNNYQILDKNYRRGRSEVDIIAQKSGFVIFVEVKSLQAQGGIFPEQQVTREKVFQVQAAANVYQYENKYKGNIRFDIIAITFFTKHSEIEHFKDAF